MSYIDFVWEGKTFEVPVVDRQATAGNSYVDFVTVVDALGVKGREKLLEVLFINHPVEVARIGRELLFTGKRGSSERRLIARRLVDKVSFSFREGRGFRRRKQRGLDLGNNLQKIGRKYLYRRCSKVLVDAKAIQPHHDTFEKGLRR